MGAVRKAYSARCNFFADDSSLTNRINWYLVPDDTPVYDQPHVFFPRVDDHGGTGPSPFEETGPGRLVRSFNDGVDTWGFPKDHVDGDESDFLGQSSQKKYRVDGNPPTRPCPMPCTCDSLHEDHLTLTASVVFPDFMGIAPFDIVLNLGGPLGDDVWQATDDFGFPGSGGEFAASCAGGDTSDCTFEIGFGWISSPFGELNVTFSDDLVFTCSPFSFVATGHVFITDEEDGPVDTGTVASIRIIP